MTKRLGWLLFGLALSLLTGCSVDPGTGPDDVKWDRETCERCRMVLSDRNHSAQIRYYPANKKRSKVMKFDDIGCAVIWLEDKPWKDDPKTQIWVTDRHGGGWLNAREAFYIKGDLTPMEYGLGAQQEAAEGSLNYEQAKEHIFVVEKRFNLHGLDLLKRLQERQSDRQSDRVDFHNHNSGETQQ
ncbi:multidrug ABC transporter ATPase [Sedimenticola thiotaurini]|uniref:Multidrug ABC transporter ATPase n=1 Tax=Sedimenticola thiotaurini TaxID=1543721 RepID=A0A0F7K1J6_9GAMM|nr:multidrug ABC transporter ATPase [Sedimenticola thiotaurini]AKH20823.1 multidrug ABC transporter ATPase [Sedimenticola thiotaurini]